MVVNARYLFCLHCVLLFIQYLHNLTNKQQYQSQINLSKHCRVRGNGKSVTRMPLNFCTHSCKTLHSVKILSKVRTWITYNDLQVNDEHEETLCGKNY